MLTEVSQVTIFHSSNPREQWMIYRGPGFLAGPYTRSSAPRPSPSPLSKLSLWLSLPVDLRSSLPMGKGWAGSQIIRPRQSLALYKSFNTLCLTLYIQWGILGMGFTKCEYCFLHNKISLKWGMDQQELLMHTLCLQIAINFVILIGSYIICVFVCMRFSDGFFCYLRQITALQQQNWRSSSTMFI
jgi:hypothetical protein